jgi:hypothetical protein
MKDGEPWTNTLGMRLLPLDNIHLTVFQTRLRDFATFVQATNYDAEGGMSSAMKQDGLGRRILSWKLPGYPQTLDDPLVSTTGKQPASKAGGHFKAQFPII